jgi:RNA polymerase sigma factor (TIGR02999 family)
VEPEQSQHLAIVLYDRLRSLARARMSGQRGAHTLDPTGLANEAVLRLLKCDPSRIRDEQHFLALAAEAMRQILVDHARAKTAQKRGDGAKAESLSEDLHFSVQLRADPAEILSLSEALTALEEEDEDAATIVKMRAFVGMECDEIAALLGVSKRTVERRWRYAMAELRAKLSDEDVQGKRGGDPPVTERGEMRDDEDRASEAR